METGGDGDGQKEILQAARDAALRLLARRDHTLRELALKLKARGFDNPISEKAIAACVQHRYLNENEFARSFREQMTSKGYSARFIRSAMKQKGFADRQIDAAFSEYDGAADETRAAQSAAARKLKTLRHIHDHFKKKEKLFRFLFARGFSRETVYEVLKWFGEVA